MSGNPPTAQSNVVRARAGRRAAPLAAPLLAALLLAACGGQEPVSEAPDPAARAASESGAARTPRVSHTDETETETVVQADAPPRAPVIYDAVVRAAYPHDTGAFTQGLFVADGILYESTGQRGASRLRRLDLETGETLAEAALPDAVFGEGSTVVGDRVVVLTWRAGEGYVHDLRTLAREARFPLAGEGWGLAYDADADRLVVSDGTSTLRFLDPDTFAQTGAVRVTLGGRPVGRLNELEWVAGFGDLPGAGEGRAGEGAGPRLLANVWQQDFILAIDLETGVADAVIDVSRLFPAERRADQSDDVPNGIAYDEEAGRLFLTGKRWPELFEVELKARP